MDGFTYHDMFATKGIEYILTIVFFALLIPFWLILKYRTEIAAGIKKGLGILSEKILSVPKGLMYGKNHTWTYMEKSGAATLGIDDFLAHLTGDVQIEFEKQPGEEVRKGDLLAKIGKDKRKLSIYAPISGKVLKTNEELVENPSVLTADPYNKGWVFEIEPVNWKMDTNQLYFADDAKKWIGSELIRFKDFVAKSFKTENDPGLIALQDGGELKDNTLSELPDNVWSDFEKEFLSI